MEARENGSIHGLQNNISERTTQSLNSLGSLLGTCYCQGVAAKVASECVHIWRQRARQREREREIIWTMVHVEKDKRNVYQTSSIAVTFECLSGGTRTAICVITSPSQTPRLHSALHIHQTSRCSAEEAGKKINIHKLHLKSTWQELKAAAGYCRCFSSPFVPCALRSPGVGREQLAWQRSDILMRWQSALFASAAVRRSIVAPRSGGTGRSMSLRSWHRPLPTAAVPHHRCSRC